MQKGRAFERQIEKVLDYINNIGFHAHKNYAQRTIEGQFIKGESFDYEAFLPGYKCVFDAKECKVDVWRMKEKDIIQAEHLKHCKNAGLEAYFLILFGKDEVLEIDVDHVINVLKSGSKSIDKSLGHEWELMKRIKSL